jgi:multidrug efflux system membrane fusion protein
MMNDQRIATRPSAAPPVETDRPRRSLAGPILLGIAVVLIGGVAWAFLHNQKVAAETASAAASAAANRTIPVLTTKVAQRDVPVWLDGLGNVSAFYTVTVKTLVDGRADKVLFTEGQHVKKGDMLVQIDPRPFAIQLESAQAALERDNANLKNSRVNLDRYKTLSDQNLIAVQQMTDQQSTVDQLQAQIRSDQSQIDSARLNLDYAHITSPIDGVTGVRLVDPGNIVHAADQTGLVVVTQLDPIAVFFTLPEDDLPAIHDAMAKGELGVQALSRSGEKQLGDGKLAVIDNEINQATATIRLKAIFPNPQSLLWPNQFVKARLRLSTRTNAIVVPAAVVQHGPQGTFAYVVGADSTAAVRPVTVDAIQGEVAIISKGLQVGEQVVTDGQAQLRPGAKVAAKPAPPPGSKSGDGSSPLGRPSDSAAGSTGKPSDSGRWGAAGAAPGAGDKP